MQQLGTSQVRFSSGHSRGGPPFPRAPRAWWAGSLCFALDPTVLLLEAQVSWVPTSCVLLPVGSGPGPVPSPGPRQPESTLAHSVVRVGGACEERFWSFLA